MHKNEMQLCQTNSRLPPPRYETDYHYIAHPVECRNKYC